jgi:hypothetical protein
MFDIEPAVISINELVEIICLFSKIIIENNIITEKNIDNKLFPNKPNIKPLLMLTSKYFCTKNDIA